jgi:hypothetical protein
MSTFGNVAVYLPPMTDHDALDLLLSGYTAEGTDAYKSAWAEVAGRLGHLALALHQAATYLKYARVSIGSAREFLAIYEGKQRSVQQRLDPYFWEYWKTQCYDATMQERAMSAFITWEMMLDCIRIVDDQSEALICQFLSTLAFTAPTRIGDFIFREWITAAPEWTDMFHSEGEDLTGTGLQLLSTEESSSSRSVYGEGIREQATEVSNPRGCRRWDPVKFKRCVRRLYDLSLLIEVSGSDDQHENFQLHHLIGAWLQAKQDVEGRQTETRIATGFVTSAFAQAQLTLPQLWQLRVHIDACVWNDAAFVHPTYRLGAHVSTCPSAACFASISTFPGRYELARRLIDLVVETRKEHLGSEDPTTLSNMNLLAEVYGQLGRKSEAKELKKEVLYISWNNLGANPVEIENFFMKMRGLVLLYHTEMRYKAAEDLSLDMIDKIGKVPTDEGFDPHGSDLVLANRLLATSLLSQGKWEAAEERFSSVLERSTRTFGAEADATLESKMELAKVLVFQGRRNSAKLLEDEVKEAISKKSAMGKPDWMEDLENVPSVHEPPETRPQWSNELRKWPNPETNDSERIREIVRISRLPPTYRARWPAEYADIPLGGVGPSPPSQPDANPPIQYRALAQDKSEIRLLTVHPGEFESTIHCKLTHACLGADPKYTGLSYCWNETKGVNQPREAGIILDNRATTVGKSAEVALRYLRSPKDDVVVWVDAICINQQDLNEKSQQVRMMGEIYSHGK